MLRRVTSRLGRLIPERPKTLRGGQLDSRDLRKLVSRVVERAGWEPGGERLVVEVGTGSGRGSTVAIHKALAKAGHSFRLIGYEGDSELAGLAIEQWRDAPEVRIVNEYFLHPGDVDRLVKPLVAPHDRESYLPELDEMAAAENLLRTLPPGPIDLLFVDSVRYTHLAILKAVMPWLTPETVVLMEDDIPDGGELAIVAKEFELRETAVHPIRRHEWPVAEFRLG